MLKQEAGTKPLSDRHKHHIVPSRVHKHINRLLKGEIDLDKFLVELEESLHLKGLHGKAGGPYVNLWKDAIMQYRTQMKTPAFVIGFAFGAMDQLGFGSVTLVP